MTMTTPPPTSPTRKPRKSRAKKTPPPVPVLAESTPPSPEPEPEPTPEPTVVDSPRLPVWTRTRRTPFERRAAQLVWFLQRHAVKPYGPRGSENIRLLAVEVAHRAHLELAEAQ
jgi:hypothetical protein